ncbi:MAG: HlyU family transcriptional regulator [Acidiferrobacterales bacterium]
MVLKFLRKLVSGKHENSDPTRNQVAVNYKGYTIIPTPQKVGAGWTTEGDISKEIDDVPKSQHFIRVDTFTDRDEAISYSIVKAKRIIDEQGDALFGGK